METLSLVMILAFGVFHSPAQEKAAGKASPICPMREQQKPSAQDQHHEGVVKRGDEVMGFSHDKARHHFQLYADGGAIEAESTSEQDTATRDAIRSHFAHIVKMFTAGDFSAPMLIHAQNPPGTAEMKRLREAFHTSWKPPKEARASASRRRSRRRCAPYMSSCASRSPTTKPPILPI